MRHTVATKAKLSRQRRGEGNPFYGRTHTPETKAKLAASTRRLNSLRRYTPNKQRIRMPIGEQLGYVAGMADGEGSFRFSGGRPFVAIYGEWSIVNWLKQNVGGSYGKPDTRGRINNYAWRISAARDVQVFCLAVLPLLIVKKDDCQALLDWVNAKYG